ncbi:hypothetical protein AX14_012691 [Amanita brunnescens Koide BX004]|nr:hypothetical protein AX14_012691 [Amanita brunnescens Koide BX004]
MKPEAHDKIHNVLYMDVVLSFHIFSPVQRGIPARLLMRFDLEKQDDVYLISRQGSFMHADELAKLTFLPASSVAQLLGYWRPRNATATVEPHAIAQEANMMSEVFLRN